MRGWKQGDGFLAGQESRDCFDLISDVVIYGLSKGSRKKRVLLLMAGPLRGGWGKGLGH